MAAIVLYFHAHQPYRIKPFDIFSIGQDDQYYDSSDAKLSNPVILNKVAHKCYLPANQTLLHLLETVDDFKVSFSLSGVFLEQLETYQPQVLDSFKALVDTGKVELVNETYYHSLAFLHSTQEFYDQIHLHRQKLRSLFGVAPTAFRNTELIYSDALAELIADIGFEVMLAEGVDRYLDWRSPNFVYSAHNLPHLKLLLKNYRLSDDIAFRFSNRGWSGYPLTAGKFAHWISQVNGNGHVVNLFMDYETFGEHQWEDTGIFQFLHHLPSEIKKHPDNTFMTVTEAARSFPAVSPISYPDLTSWADLERDLSAWISNAMQQQALEAVFALKDQVFDTQNPHLIHSWRKLTTSDHFYYMCTKWFSDGDVHKYFSPNETPFEAFNHFMTILHDLRQRVYANKNTKESAHAHRHTTPLR